MLPSYRVFLKLGLKGGGNIIYIYLLHLLFKNIKVLLSIHFIDLYPRY